LQGIATAALLNAGLVAGVLGGHRLVVKTGQRHRTGHHLPRCRPIGKAIFLFRRIAAMKTHPLAGGWRQAEGIVKHHQLDLRMLAINMLEAPGITLFVQQPHDEVEIALAILQTITARAGRGGVEPSVCTWANTGLLA
jgi:hypothetical protein